ncbi:hypothetical protein ACFFRR_000008 [Megaselia abdita]
MELKAFNMFLVIFLLFVTIAKCSDIDSEIRKVLKELDKANDLINKDIKKTAVDAIEDIRTDDISYTDLKAASTASIEIEDVVQDYMKGISLITYAIGVMAYRLNVYKVYINANYTEGQKRMDAMIKLNPTAYYINTRQLQPNTTYL